MKELKRPEVQVAVRDVDGGESKGMSDSAAVDLLGGEEESPDEAEESPGPPSKLSFGSSPDVDWITILESSPISCFSLYLDLNRGFRETLFSAQESDSGRRDNVLAAVATKDGLFQV